MLMEARNLVFINKTHLVWDLQTRIRKGKIFRIYSLNLTKFCKIINKFQINISKIGYFTERSIK